MLPEPLSEPARSTERGDSALSEELFTALYEDLRRLARREFRRGARAIKFFDKARVVLERHLSED
jgi:hypothetical protein